MEATTKDLRLHTRALIAATDRGEEVIITFRGKPRARLLPLVDSGVSHPDSARERERNPLFGLWSDKAELTVEAEVRALRKPRNSR